MDGAVGSHVLEVTGTAAPRLAGAVRTGGSGAAASPCGGLRGAEGRRLLAAGALQGGGGVAYRQVGAEQEGGACAGEQRG